MSDGLTVSAFLFMIGGVFLVMFLLCRVSLSTQTLPRTVIMLLSGGGADEGADKTDKALLE